MGEIGFYVVVYLNGMRFISGWFTANSCVLEFSVIIIYEYLK